MAFRLKMALWIVCTALCLSGGSALFASPYVTQGPFVSPGPGGLIPRPEVVPGKEYSHNTDQGGHDSAHAADPEQVIAWDGVGGTADTFDYSGSRINPFDDTLDRQVDALANSADALYSSVVNNTSALLFSIGAGPGAAHIFFEDIAGNIGIWATPSQIDAAEDVNGNPTPITDVDGLEVWGPEGADDSNRYSVVGDPVIDPSNGLHVSVFGYDGVGTSFAHFYREDIAGALGLPRDEPAVDVDATMVSGNRLMFSVAPSPFFNGAEIWTWTGVGLATPLFHGGHLWDTAWTSTFLAPQITALLDVPDITLNVDALEAVSTPEPSTYMLFGLGALALLAWRRRRQAA